MCCKQHHTLQVAMIYDHLKWQHVPSSIYPIIIKPVKHRNVQKSGLLPTGFTVIYISSGAGVMGPDTFGDFLKWGYP